MQKKQKINGLAARVKTLRKGQVRYQTVAYHTMPPLASILELLRLEQYARVLAKRKMTTAKLIGLTDRDLEMLGMKTGHRRRLQNHLQKLIGDKPPPLPTPEPSEVASVDDEESISSASDREATRYQQSDSSDSSVHEEEESDSGTEDDSDVLGDANDTEEEEDT